MPAPTSSSREACSRTVTVCPFRARVMEVARPPSPAPTTITSSLIDSAFLPSSFELAWLVEKPLTVAKPLMLGMLFTLDDTTTLCDSWPEDACLEQFIHSRKLRLLVGYEGCEHRSAPKTCESTTKAFEGQLAFLESLRFRVCIVGLLDDEGFLRRCWRCRHRPLSSVPASCAWLGRNAVRKYNPKEFSVLLETPTGDFGSPCGSCEATLYECHSCHLCYLKLAFGIKLHSRAFPFKLATRV